MNKIAIFDLDRTFINSNSTYEFIKFFLKKSPIYYKRKIFVFVFSFLENIGIPLHLLIKKRSWFVSLLKDTNEEELKKTAQDFVKKRLARVINKEVFMQFKRLKQEGYYCVICSTSLDVVVEAFANSFDFDDDWFASTLAFDNDGKCLGYLNVDLTGKKEKSLLDLEKKIGAIDFKNSFFFSDNKEDINLMQKIGNSFAIVSNPLRRKFWREKNIHVLSITPALKIDPRIFLIPVSYYSYFRSNIKNFLYYHFGFLVFCLFLFKVNFSIADLLYLLGALLGYIAIHEIGYLTNDCLGTKKEVNPSLRAGPEICNRMKYFILSRITFFAIILLLLSTGVVVKLLINYFIGVVLILIIFLIHNSIKQNLRMGTYCILVLSHFLIPLLIFEVKLMYPVLAVILFYLPLRIVSYIQKIYDIKLDRSSLHIKIVSVLMLFLLMFLFLIANMFYPAVYPLFWSALYLNFVNILYYAEYIT